ncbi:hypothetical protein OQA88_4556 [Cercophora sp. LCS_1]
MDLRRLLSKIPGAGILLGAASTPTPATLPPTDLRSLLCKEEWSWHPLWNRISFHKDGTGEIFLGVEYSRFIAAKFKWEPADGLLDFILDPGNPAILGQFKLRLTLLKKCALPDENRYHINDAVLTDDAFLPKTFTITLSKGCFLSPYDALGDENNTLACTPRYALRLSFDPSPYPPESEWVEQKGASGWKANRVWEWTDFCGYKIQE